MDSIRIDYDNIDVADIMSQIKAWIAARPAASSRPSPVEPREGRAVPAAPQPGPPESPGPRSKAKRILLKIMSPFAPVIKLMVLPVHEELRQTILSLDRTNRRIDALVATTEETLERLNTSIGEGLGHANERIDQAFLELHKGMDYIKLLHNLSHNIVVELTKLKIEEETLRSKARIMEKDFEFLQKREKALEKLTLR